MSFFGVYKGKKVLVTGHTGFKGSWLSIWLSQLGATVIGVSDNVPSDPANYYVSDLPGVVKNYAADIRDRDKLGDILHSEAPDVVFHMAAQALVRPSYEDPLSTITANAIGTANVLDALRNAKKHTVAVMITSDKVYDNVEWKWGYRENDRLGGKDPYSASKAMAELAIRTYYHSFLAKKDSRVVLGITRAGNVIGGGDWAKDRIVPDCMHAWSQAKAVDIRSPGATRPWQHVLEPLSGYLLLGAVLCRGNRFNGEAYNFGPAASQNYSVSELIESMRTYWDSVRWDDISAQVENVHEAGLLKLNCDKALVDLGWQATLMFDETVRMTVEWYKYYYENNPSSMFDYSVGQISSYIDLARQRGSVWAE